MIKLKDVETQMIANNLSSSSPVHPGEMLRDEMECRGLTAQRLAEQMGVSAEALCAVLDEESPISAETALLLEAVLDIDARVWTRLQNDYDMEMAKADKGFRERLAHIRKVVAAL